MLPLSVINYANKAQVICHALNERVCSRRALGNHTNKHNVLSRWAHCWWYIYDLTKLPLYLHAVRIVSSIWMQMPVWSYIIRLCLFMAQYRETEHIRQHKWPHNLYFRKAKPHRAWNWQHIPLYYKVASTFRCLFTLVDSKPYCWYMLSHKWFFNAKLFFITYMQLQRQLTSQSFKDWFL